VKEIIFYILNLEFVVNILPFTCVFIMEAMKVDNNQKLLPNFELLSSNVVSLML